MRASEILSSEASEVLANLWELDAQQRQHHDRGPDSLKAVHPSVAELLHVLILQKQANTMNLVRPMDCRPSGSPMPLAARGGMSTVWTQCPARHLLRRTICAQPDLPIR